MCGLVQSLYGIQLWYPDKRCWVLYYGNMGVALHRCCITATWVLYYIDGCIAAACVTAACMLQLLALLVFWERLWDVCTLLVF